MTLHRWSKFWWQDYAADAALAMCSLAAQGLWMRILCAMHEAQPYGNLVINGAAPTERQLAIMLRATAKEIAKLIPELEAAGVFNRHENGIIYSRRMVRDKEASEKAAEHGRRGGNPAITPNASEPLTLPLTPSHKGTLKLEAEAEEEARKKDNNLTSKTRVASAVPTDSAPPVEMPWPPDPHPSAITSRVSQVAIKLGIRQQRAEPAKPARTVEEQIAMLRLTQSPTP